MKNYLSKLHKNLNEGKFIFTSEFCSPKGVDTAIIEEKVDLLKESVIAAKVAHTIN